MIGVFDSGIGGLTVVRQIRSLMPNEDIIYLGDTARVPYGTKSQETVVRFACEDAQFLVEQGVKAIVVACNTASAWSLPVLNRYFHLPICGVIVPGSEAALIVSRNKRVGVIGTASTVRSKAYDTAMKERLSNVEVFAQACPLLVPLVEEGWLSHPVTFKVLEEYLTPLVIEQIDTLILGCTHYPLLAAAIGYVMGDGVALVSSSQEAARAVYTYLADHDLFASKDDRPQHTWATTGDPESFSALARRFLRQNVQVQQIEEIKGSVA